MFFARVHPRFWGYMGQQTMHGIEFHACAAWWGYIVWNMNISGGCLALLFVSNAPVLFLI